MKKTNSAPHAHDPMTYLRLLAVMLLTTLQIGAAQFENFDDGNDNGWTRFAPLAPIGVAATFSFPDDGLGGKAYRIQSAAPPISILGPARAGSRVIQSYTDFTVAVDLIDWDNSLDQSIGFLFRTETLGIGTTTGYSMNYNAQQISGGPGQIQFNKVTGEVPSGAIRYAELNLEPGRGYRFCMTARGTTLIGQVYDLANLTSPIVTFSKEDPVYSQGEAGLFNFYAGEATLDPVAGRTDATFDNYTLTTEPSPVPEPGASRGIPGWPQPIELTPLDRSTFVSPASVIQFIATTLSEEKILPGNVTLLLNGQNMSSQITFEETDAGLKARLGNLRANTVYDGVIQLANAAGVRSSTEWTFDTFSDDFLESADVKVIEAEDFNFRSGQYIDDPAPSGRLIDATDVNATNGYLDRIGEPGIDYFDRSEEEGSGETPEFRFANYVGTQAGSSEIGALDRYGGLDAPINDFVRRKYASLNLPEYQVRGTEGGEWLNYTRDFSDSSYNVYLRVAARVTQQVFLDEVTSDPSRPDQNTSRLGIFNVPNLGIKTNYRFVPLTDETGNRAVLNLSGKKTLRLTLGGEPGLRTRGTMALNYFVFVPAESEIQPTRNFLVESAAQVDGPFAIESSATISDDTITIPISAISGASRFFRLTSRDSPAITIRAVAVSGQNFVIRLAL